MERSIPLEPRKKLTNIKNAKIYLAATASRKAMLPKVYGSREGLNGKYSVSAS